MMDGAQRDGASGEATHHQVPLRTETLFPIGAYTVGYVHDLSLTAGTVMGLRGQVTFNTRPGSLVVFYGSQTPWGFELFARFRPTALR